MNYSFLLKCLAGVALLSVLMALFLKPILIVVGATTALAAVGSVGFFLSCLIIIPPIVAVALLISMSNTPTISYSSTYPAGSSYFTFNPFLPSFWYRPTYGTNTWNTPLFTNHSHSHNTHGHRNVGSRVSGYNTTHGHNAAVDRGSLNVGHLSSIRQHGHSLFAGGNNTWNNISHSTHPQATSSHNHGHSSLGLGHNSHSPGHR